MKLSILASVLIILLSVIPAYSQGEKGPAAVPAVHGSIAHNFVPLSEIRSGMKGTAKTVFEGSEPEPFDVEILGVLPNGIGPKQDLIIARISGGAAERTQVFAGMSGSPVYIDGKLAGAISYAFPFSTEAICGITPIEQMISIFEKVDAKASKPRIPRSYSFAELASEKWSPFDARVASTVYQVPQGTGSSAAVNMLAGQSFAPIATPLNFSGFAPKTIEHFAGDLSRLGLVPVSGIAGSTGSDRIKPSTGDTLNGGDSVAVELTRGDFGISASGTVTLRDNENIYAFGHPFLSLGSSSLPMSESSVIVVVPSLNNSFKMSVSEALVGTITQDRTTGVYGRLGTSPRMIPVRLNLRTSRNKTETLNFEIAEDEFLTPLLLNITVFNAITAHERGIGNLTVSVDGQIKLKDKDPVEIAGRFAGQISAMLATKSVVMPTFSLMTSDFDDLAIKGIELNIASTDDEKTAVLQRISVDRSKVRPGEIVEIEAFIRTNTGRVLSQKIPFKIPLSTPYGRLKIALGDGDVLQMTSVDQQFVPESLEELVAKINKLKKNDLLYLQAKRVTTGAVIGSSELPNLPPSVLATLNTSRTSGVYTPTVESVVAEMQVPKAEYIITGNQELEITVVD